MSEIPGPAPEPGTAVNQPAAGEAAVRRVAAAGNALPADQTEPQPPVASMRTGAATPPGKPVAVAGPAGPRFQNPSKVNTGWWVLAILLLAVAVVSSFAAARGTAFSHANRWSAAGAALLDVLALATLAHVNLLWHQSRIAREPAAGPDQDTLNYRRRGLKAAVMGQDGRASTSKTQVVVWTAAVLWALIYLLLLARAYPGGNLLTGAVTGNWRPEYLVLLGLPVAAAVTAKAVVSGSNAGQGPVKKSHPAAKAGQEKRVYVRDPVPAGVKGFAAGVAELISADDGTVAWADLQYVVFTLITLVYFLVQVLAQPQHGLPPVPAALLTLMGVSASGYMAAKIVETMMKGGRSISGQGLERRFGITRCLGCGSLLRSHADGWFDCWNCDMNFR